MTSNLWLEFRSRNPGVEGPYIQEYHRPYQMLDRAEATKKDVILAIGPEASQRCFGAAGTRPPRQAVTLHSVTLAERKTILVNCQLPFRCELSRIPDAIELGHHTLHHLKGAYPHAPQVACSLYTELLAPFSSVVILFVSEFGALARVVDFLWSWLRSAMLRPPPFCPEVILAVGQDDLATLSEIRLRLVNYGLKSLRISDPQHAYSFADVDKMMGTHLNLSMISTSPVSEFSGSLQASLQRAHCKQQQLGIDFTVGHWKALVRSALAGHAERPAVPINFYHLSRLRKPVPLNMSSHMSEFVRATNAHDIDQAMIIASALSIDAFPPGMHRFPPERLFHEIYEPVLRNSKAAKLIANIKEAFTTQNSISTIHVASLQTHLTNIQKFHDQWRQIILKRSCLICLARQARYALTCDHVLCVACMRMLQTDKMLDICLPYCPLCKTPNTISVLLNPPTAGNRILRLSGHDVSNIIKYLKDLQSLIGLTTFPLRAYFDEVIASDSAMFVAVAVFLEGWTLADCKYHSKAIKKPKLTRANVLDFGNNLSWCMAQMKSENQTFVVLEGQHTIFSRFPPVTPKEFQPFIKTQAKSHDSRRNDDIHIEYNGGPSSPRLLQSVSSHLTSKLFYVEAASHIFFYSSPTKFKLSVKCRVPFGPALLDLLQRLLNNRAFITYNGSETDTVKAQFVTAQALRICKKTASFSFDFATALRSPDSLIDIRIGGGNEVPDSISKCPYRLQDLIDDQGLERPFGTEDHQRLHLAKLRRTDMHTEIDVRLDELHRTLQQMT